MQTLEYQDSYELIDLSDLVKRAREFKGEGYRLVQLLPKMQEDDRITLIYTFGKLNELINLKIVNVVKDLTKVPSITSIFVCAFVFENEAHDLFGVQITGNSLDFHGHFYNFAEGVEAPMTIVTPAQLAAREKKAKLEAAKKAKARKLAAQAEKGNEASGNNEAEEARAKEKADAELEAKLAAMDPEKAAKVRAAMAAKAARDAKKNANDSTANAEEGK